MYDCASITLRVSSVDLYKERSSSNRLYSLPLRRSRYNYCDDISDLFGNIYS